MSLSLVRGRVLKVGVFYPDVSLITCSVTSINDTPVRLEMGKIDALILYRAVIRDGMYGEVKTAWVTDRGAIQRRVEKITKQAQYFCVLS